MAESFKDSQHGAKSEALSLMAERIKYKSLLKKKCKREYGDGEEQIGKGSGEKETLVKTDVTQENETSNPRWQDTDHIIRKIDYDNLERSLFIT